MGCSKIQRSCVSFHILMKPFLNLLEGERGHAASTGSRGGVSMRQWYMLFCQHWFFPLRRDAPTPRLETLMSDAQLSYPAMHHTMIICKKHLREICAALKRRKPSLKMSILQQYCQNNLINNTFVTSGLLTTKLHPVTKILLKFPIYWIPKSAASLLLFFFFK